MRTSTLIAATVITLAIAKDATAPCKGNACPAKTGNQTATQAKNTVAKPGDAKNTVAKKEESKTEESSKKDNTKGTAPAKEGEKKPISAAPKEGEKKVESADAENGAATTVFSVAALSFVAVLALATF